MLVTRPARVFITLMLAFSLFTAAPASAAARLSGNTIQGVTGTLEDGSTFEGRIVNVDATAGQISGKLVGTVTDTAGNTTRIVQDFTTTLDITNTTGTCDILQLDIGPIDLALLGLVVNISPISVNVDARGGKLLGNLLCAIAGLLD